MGRARKFTASATYKPESIEFYAKANGSGANVVFFLGVFTGEQVSEIVYSEQITIDNGTVAWKSANLFNTNLIIKSGFEYAIGAIVVAKTFDASNNVLIGYGVTTSDVLWDYDDGGSVHRWQVQTTTAQPEFRINGVLA